MTETQSRLYRNLYLNLGEQIINLLADDQVDEILLNADGVLWADTVGVGMVPVGNMDALQADTILRSVAGINNFAISYQQPYIETELPFYQALAGQRFSGQMPPIVSAPIYTIRKKSKQIFTLDDYVASERLTAAQRDVLITAVAERKNILISGGVGTGKTTFANALITHIDQSHRVAILEDTVEIRCLVPNKIAYVTRDGVSMTKLLRIVMRMRPDRILVGEVRGREALAMLKAWNTGCPGGICTIHANNARTALQRVLDLAMEAGLKVPPISLLTATIDIIVSIGFRAGGKGFINEILQLKGYTHEKFVLETLV